MVAEAAAIVAITVLLVFLGFSWRQPSTVPERAADQNITTSAPPPYRQLTNGSWEDRSPSWSPDGGSIAYMSNRSGSWSVWVMKADGSGGRQVSPTGLNSMYPTWSPDSSSLAFWYSASGTTGFAILNLGSGSLNKVTAADLTVSRQPIRWSPQGDKLLFIAQGAPAQVIVYSLASGSYKGVASMGAQNLTASWLSDDMLTYSDVVGGEDEIRWLGLSSAQGGIVVVGSQDVVSPAGSPNGSLVAYFCDIFPHLESQMLQSYGGYNVWVGLWNGSNARFQYVMAAIQYDGRIREPVPYVPGVMDLSNPPTWSPDGRRIAYAASDALFGYNLYIWDVGNWTTRGVGPLWGNAVEPSWSPDGLNLTFSCDLGGRYHIWVTGWR